MRHLGLVLLMFVAFSASAAEDRLVLAQGKAPQMAVPARRAEVCGSQCSATGPNPCVSSCNISCPTGKSAVCMNGETTSGTGAPLCTLQTQCNCQ
jgi:hypothetical protein